jgi:hypothetical protein
MQNERIYDLRFEKIFTFLSRAYPAGSGMLVWVKNYFVHQHLHFFTHIYLRPIRIQEGFCEGSHR